MSKEQLADILMGCRCVWSHSEFFSAILYVSLGCQYHGVYVEPERRKPHSVLHR